jgi:hypothetical protein
MALHRAIPSTRGQPYRKSMPLLTELVPPVAWRCYKHDGPNGPWRFFITREGLNSTLFHYLNL